MTRYNVLANTVSGGDYEVDIEAEAYTIERGELSFFDYRQSSLPVAVFPVGRWSSVLNPTAVVVEDEGDIDDNSR